jgi:uncharacterized protein (TIGR02444 family)
MIMARALYCQPFTTDTGKPMPNPFWDYSLSAYAEPGVADACLAAQDGCGLDVNLLLYAAWLASTGRALTEAHLAGVEEEVGEWRSRVIIPLRTLRRDLKSLAAADTLREQVKALELQSERHQQDLMWQLFQRCPPEQLSTGLLPSNLDLLFRTSGATGPDAAACQSCLLTALEGVAEVSAQ